MNKTIVRVGVSLLLSLITSLPITASAASTIPAKIVEPSPSNFQTWTFSPSTLTIRVGDTVAWTNTGQANHTVTDPGIFDSGNVAPGAGFSLSFSKPGTYNYQCTYHPWMKGTVDVLAAGQNATPPTATPAPRTPVPPSPTLIPPTASASPVNASSVAQPTLAPTTAAGPATPTTAASPSVQPTDTAVLSATFTPPGTTHLASVTTPTTGLPTLTSLPPSPTADRQPTPTTTESAGSVNPAALGAGIVGLLILGVVGLALARRRG